MEFCILILDCDWLQIWYTNVPHTGLVSYKADQQWVKKQGDKLVFPGGGTQFMQGAGHYIDFVEKVYFTLLGWRFGLSSLSSTSELY